MAASAREERVRRRELKREEDERRKRKIKEETREEAEAVEIVRRRLQRSQLEDQGVILTDEDDPNEGEVDDETESRETEEETEYGQADPPSLSLEGESHFVYEEEYNLTLSTSEEEDEDGEQKTEGDEVYERTRYVEEEKARIEERMQQLYQREQQALQRERELEERRLEFERQMKADEERLRQAMKSKIKKEMYDESIKILNKLETDLLKQQNVTLEKEKEISRKERELQRKEIEWKAREVEAKRQLKKKIKRELQESTGGDFKSKKESKDSRQKKIKQEIEEMTEYSDDYEDEAEPQSSQKVLAPKEKNIGIQVKSSIGDKVTKSELVPPSVILSEATRKKVSLKTDKEEDGKYGKSKVSHVSTSKTQTKQDEAEGFVLKPYVGPFSGTQPTPKHENTFEVWKLEIQSLMAMKVYSDISIVQAIWKSLKGQARNVLFNIGPSAKADDIVKRLESVYGNVASGEAVLQEFYTVHQEENESVTDWGLRLEQILQRAKEKGHVNEERKDQMLRDKFWRSLYDQNLKNATKIYHQSLTSFEKLQQKVRAEEYEMKESVAKKQQTVTQKDRKRPAQHQPQLTEMDDQLQLLKSMSENLVRMDKDIQQLKKGQSRGDWRSRRRGRGRGDRKQNETDTNKIDNTERKEIRESGKQADDKKGPLN